MATIGVFDSGIGGLSVVMAIEQAMPDAIVIFKNDTEHMPYGNKSPEQLLELVVPLFRQFEAAHCDAIVIACNTVTTTLIEQLRALFSIPLVGIEPMIKPASQLTSSKIVAVCATPTTLSSQRYHELKDTFAAHITVLEPDCSQWASMIEHDQVQENAIKLQIDEVCNAGADVIVLACTHYHWIEELINTTINGRATLLQPEQAIITQLQRVLAK